MKFSRDFDQNSGIWTHNSCEIFPRFDQSSSSIRWPRNSYEIFKNFDQNSVGQPLYPTIQMTIKFFKSRWPQNSYEILEGFWSEFWLLAIVSNNSDDYEILQELDDHGILVKFFQDLRNSCEILSGFWSELFSRIRWHGILMKSFQGFWSIFRSEN
jgi:hypothetical protein